MSADLTLVSHKATVLLIDDQPMIGEMVRRMIAAESEIAFHYCKEPRQAIETAKSVRPTVILQDLVMPDIDGLELVSLFREDEFTRDIPLIVLSTKEEPTVKAEAFSRGANDYLVKLPDKLELIARIRYHSRGYIAMLERNEAYKALQESQRKLADEVAKAAAYVKSLLPAPLIDGPLRADWRFIPSADLGGDAFNYHPLDDDHFAFYLLDVCGHGVGAALLSVSALNSLRSQSLPSTDFRDPGQVLAALNRAFQMDQQNDMYFTIWYGVYNRPNRRISYSGGGHPPALLLSGPAEAERTVHILDSTGLAIGMFPDMEYETLTHQLGDGPQSLLFYSDGVYELIRPDSSMWSFEAFADFLKSPVPRGVNPIERIIDNSRQVQGKDDFVDDFSVVEVQLQE
jgi:sigma-B regulation protein RsbU (phosphoserine phosphatase)